MRRLLMILSLIMVCSPAFSAIAAQQDVIDMAFDDSVLRSYGYPEPLVEVAPDGVNAPVTVEARFYLVTLSTLPEYSAYLDIMQPPAGLSVDAATALALDAARNDLAQDDWFHIGGTNTFEPDVPVSFIIDLPVGEFQWASSYYLPEQDSEEIMTLAPLSVTEPATGAIPVAATSPEAAVTLEMTDDLHYVVTPDLVPAGPQVWELTNTGTVSSHHVVMYEIPEGVTEADIIADFAGLFSGTPPAGEPLVAQFSGAGYAALQSGPTTTWIGLDLESGTYAVICFIIEPSTGQPHLMDGMVTVFTVAL